MLDFCQEKSLTTAACKALVATAEKTSAGTNSTYHREPPLTAGQALFLPSEGGTLNSEGKVGNAVGSQEFARIRGGGHWLQLSAKAIAARLTQGQAPVYQARGPRKAVGT